MKYVTHLPPIWHTELGIDIETTTRIEKVKGKKTKVSDPFRDKILSVTVSDGMSSWYLTQDYSSLIPLFIDPANTLIIHNAVFDLSFLIHNLGVVPTAKIWDTMLIERLMHAGDDSYRHGLQDVMARRYGIILDKSTRDQFADHDGINFTDEQIEYMEQDVLHLPRLYRDQLAELGGKLINPLVEDSEPCLAVIAWLEMAVLPVTIDMTLAGVSFDIDRYNTSIVLVENHLQHLEEKFANVYLPDFWHDVEKKVVEPYTELNKKGKEVVKKRRYVVTVKERKYVEEVEGGYKLRDKTLTSPAKVLSMLRDLKIYTNPKVKTTAAPFLTEYFYDNPFVKNLLEHRMWEKMLGWGYPKYVNPVTGRIHPKWNQLARDDAGGEKDAPETGRYSCADPNLQNVPRPNEQEHLPNMRMCFVPRKGYVFIVADYNQQEPRTLAQLSKDPAMIKAAKDIDIYNSLGVPVYGRPVKKGDPERQTLKVAVLADVYGVGARKLALGLGVTEDAAKAIKAQLRRAFPVAYKWGDQQLYRLKNKGYIETRWGRRRYVPEIKYADQDTMWKFGNQARNTPVQGTSADFGKLAMYFVYTRMYEAGLDGRIVMVIHDEIVVEAREDQAVMIKELVDKAMLDAMREVCPDVEPGVESDIVPYWSKG